MQPTFRRPFPVASNVFVTRLHVRYDAAHFPEDLVFQETGDRTNFQGRYVLRHPWTGTETCGEADAYRRDLPERFERRGAGAGVAHGLGGRRHPPSQRQPAGWAVDDKVPGGAGSGGSGDTLSGAMSGPETDFANPQLLIAPAALHARIGSTSGPPVLLIDTRPAEQFAGGHIAGAAHFDLFGLSLTDTDPAPLRAFLWMIEHLFAARGTAADRPVVVYDEQSGVRAARAFWFLELFGHPDVRVLDGGFNAWAARVCRFRARPRRRSRPSGRASVARRFSRPGARCRTASAGKVASLVDTRTPEEHHGTLVRAARGGTIPGSVHLEWTQQSRMPRDASSCAPELRAMYEDRRHHAGSRRRHLLSGRIPRRPLRISRCACSATRVCATTSARGANGAIASNCRSRRERRRVERARATAGCGDQAGDYGNGPRLSGGTSSCSRSP